MASQTSDDVVGSSGPRESSELRSRDLPSRRLIGKGLCGIVYETLCNDERFARKDFVEVPREIFRAEASVLLGLAGHDNIVKTHGYTVDNRSCSLVLEYMDDDLLSFLQKRKESKRKRPGNLSEASRVIDPQKFIEENRNKNKSVVPNMSDPSTCPPPLELPEALDMIIQIARGMAYLHEQKLAHGDLKPRNILVSHSNEGVRSVKVADFGLVRTKSKSMFFVSRRARMLDLAQWKAPEYLGMMFMHQFNDKRPVESDSDEDEDMASHLGDFDGLFEADVYSFAMTCFQILTGEVPYPNRNWKELVEFKIRSAGSRLKLPPVFQSKLLRDLLESCWGGPGQRPPFSFICTKLQEIIELAKRASSSSKPVERIVLDSRLQDPIISENLVSSLPDIGRDRNSDFHMPHSLMQSKSMEVTDSSSIKPVERPRSPDIVLNEREFTHEDDSADESWAVPAFAETRSSRRNRVSRALKSCMMVSSHGLKRPSFDHPPYLGESDTDDKRSGSHYSPQEEDPVIVALYHEKVSNQVQMQGEMDDAAAAESRLPPAYTSTQKPIRERVSSALKRRMIVSSGEYDKSNIDKGNPDRERTTSRERWKTAFVKIPSKMQDWAVNSVQVCKPKSSDEDYLYPGDDIIIRNEGPELMLFSESTLDGSHWRKK